MKVCTICQVSKELNEFSKDNRSKDKRQHKCKPCAKEDDFAHRLQSRFGLSVEQYYNLLAAADSKCEICGIDVHGYKQHRGDRTRACVDHDHISMEVRGILCQDCNFAIGLLKDSPDLCLNAAKYLYGRR